MSIDPTTPEIRHNAVRKRFETEVNGHTGFVEYMLAGDRIIFTHTEVHPALEGQGIAGMLAKTGLEYAREQQLKVMPLCPYVAGYMKRHPEYKDLLAPGFHV